MCKNIAWNTIVQSCVWITKNKFKSARRNQRTVDFEHGNSELVHQKVDNCYEC